VKTNKISKILNLEIIMLFGFILAKIILSLLPISYGIFRDEFYYLSMSKHLGLGYVDVPPLAPLILAGVRFLFGDSQFALHIIPAFSGALFLILAYLLVKKLNGNNYALWLVLTVVLCAPYYIAIDSIYTYDTFNKLFWVLFSYLMIRLIQTEDSKYWIYLGIASGVGLLFKITLLQLGFGWVIGLLLTKQRKLLFRREVLWATVLALLIFSPYLVWQFQHGFISLEYYHNYSGKVSEFSPFGYLMEQIMMLNLITFPIWLAGLYYLLFNEKGKRFRSAAITYFVILILSYLLKAKPDFILPYYVVIFGAGCLWLGELFAGAHKYKWWLRITVAVLVVIFGLIAIPMVRPVLPVKTFVHIFGKFSTKKNVERLALAQLPQFFADRFGWQEMTQKVAEVYQSLPEAEQKKACIGVGNYGEAGAIEFYGEKYGLPLPPVSGHNQYHIWGPGRFSGEVLIAVGLSHSFLSQYYQDIQAGSMLTNPYMMPYEKQNPIYICHKPIKQFADIKPWFKWLN
jgi:4-amino-4-deoxy-L-arabinose transferase-like glycosyltransferase